MSEPIEVLLKRLTAITRGRESAKGLHFFCQLGGAGWPGGVLTLQISGTGWTLLSHRFFEDEEEDEESSLHSVYLSSRDIRALVRLLMENPFWEFDAARWERVDNETNLHFRLADTGKAFAWGVQLWSDEVTRQPGVAALIKTLDRIIQVVSDGELSVSTIGLDIP